MNKVTANLDYIQGHIRRGHIELFLTDEELLAFKSLSKEEQEDWIHDEGEIIVDDYYLSDYGEINSIYYE